MDFYGTFGGLLGDFGGTFRELWGDFWMTFGQLLGVFWGTCWGRFQELFVPFDIIISFVYEFS